MLDLAGIGVGPMNLSLAALAAPIADIRSGFFERHPEFRWHDGLLLESSDLTVHYLKDLVTLADPCSPYSFIAYLHQQGRLFQFISAHQGAVGRVSRQEYHQYFADVARRLPNIQFAQPIDSISYQGDYFLLNNRIAARNIALGIGRQPYIPDFCRPHLGERVVSALDYLHVKPDSKGKRVVVAGGGLSAAELVHHLLHDANLEPSELIWICPRTILWPQDDAPFSNEMYAPRYVEFFYGLPAWRREEILNEIKSTGDGISSSKIDSIYRRAYDLKYIYGRDVLKLRLSRRMVDLEAGTDRLELVIRDENTNSHHQLSADLLLLATGFKDSFPVILNDLRDRLSWNGNFTVRDDYSIAWDGAADNRIFVHNAARHSHGIADPYLSLVAWRSAVMLNSLMGRAYFNTSTNESMIDWPKHGSS